jgi:hypothetical protein
MVRRIFIAAVIAAGVAGALAMRTKPLHANEAKYQLSTDKNDNSICGGTCQSGCCRIIPL